MSGIRESLRDYLAAGGCLDILFLDIGLFQMTGIEAGAYIRNQLDHMGLQIVYISGKASYAQQLFRTQPLDFLVKPIGQEQIDEVLILCALTNLFRILLIGRCVLIVAFHTGQCEIKFMKQKNAFHKYVTNPS